MDRRLSVVALAIVVCGACESVPTGPSLAAVSVTGLSTKATAPPPPATADPTVCCCHAVANVTNNNAVPVHVTVTIAAIDRENKQLGRVPAFVRDLQPGSTRPIEASGFIFPCATIARLDYELNVSSLGRSLR
jgi:hypothetical protein